MAAAPTPIPVSEKFTEVAGKATAAVLLAMEPESASGDANKKSLSAEHRFILARLVVCTPVPVTKATKFLNAALPHSVYPVGGRVAVLVKDDWKAYDDFSETYAAQASFYKIGELKKRFQTPEARHLFLQQHSLIVTGHKADEMVLPLFGSKYVERHGYPMTMGLSPATFANKLEELIKNCRVKHADATSYMAVVGNSHMSQEQTAANACVLWSQLMASLKIDKTEIRSFGLFANSTPVFPIVSIEGK
ncbi:hypothetical protein H4R33_001160 [Dimargaris cristalligena]|uniref:Uncharacterized protein n=1 Tax=Dimargaris cristalligena TaxID=215637 RepID=A0A4P9ZRR0_9FUNG|nr:hypothetical protein H4R33_001160 [Dimargaris cristalligena]RKP36236.1 hypothetical protein BJ085DRAFT_40503 [Dimargaris cristalligena]|eukprot:RKP36236.1 hypothetical protein BJ085DRAFT_40503 [Dimargaris cristalligena]